MPKLSAEITGTQEVNDHMSADEKKMNILLTICICDRYISMQIYFNLKSTT